MTSCDQATGVNHYGPTGRGVECPACGYVWPPGSGVGVGDLPPHEQPGDGHQRP